MTKAEDYINAANELQSLLDAGDFSETFPRFDGLANAIDLLKQAAEYRKAVDTLMAISDALGDEDD